jgi:uncharacterized membrane protein YesL
MHGDSADTREMLPASTHRPSAMRVLRKSVADAWSYLAFFVGANVIWVILLGLPLTLLGRVAIKPVGFACGLALTAIAVSAGNAIVFHVTNRMARGDISLRDFKGAVADHFLSSMALLAILLGVVGLGIFNVYFYVKVLSGPWWRLIGIIWGYVIVMLALAMLYSYPLLVEQRCGALKAVKRSALLFLDNPRYTLGIAGALLLWTLLVILPVLAGVRILVGLSALVLCFIEAGLVALVANNALLELLRKYDRTEKERDAAGGVSGDSGR